MDNSVPQPAVNLSPKAQAFVDSLDVELDESELREISTSLYHFGKALTLYHLEQIRGEI